MSVSPISSSFLTPAEREALSKPTSSRTSTDRQSTRQSQGTSKAPSGSHETGRNTGTPASSGRASKPTGPSILDTKI